jgi:hypothetical protein
MAKSLSREIKHLGQTMEQIMKNNEYVGKNRKNVVRNNLVVNSGNS